ncbi:Y+L amino acid transporter 2-like [Tropilaelaps mercedesae]|uniref:Y+L amino acid transporter 2-like n=1 Tax=Tropilaelaps mercedesae TaxID=418985 RepID=A0A1V9X7Q1_9ACAR|nr:Y+L amino acid transporter 2-like [Tropilaelaps mercedesae]
MSPTRKREADDPLLSSDMRSGLWHMYSSVSTTSLRPSINRSSVLSSASSRGGIKLKKQLGLLDGVNVILIIGSGIFMSPTDVLRYAGSRPFSRRVGVVGHPLHSRGPVLCRVGTAISKSNGDCAYLLESFGTLPLDYPRHRTPSPV